MQESSQTILGFSEEDVREMLGNLRGAPHAFFDLFAAESEAVLHHRAEDGWSAVEVVGHLADHDAFERSHRFEVILAQDKPALPDDHTRLQVTKANFQARSAAEALDWFTRERNAVVALLEGLHPRHWMRTGIHPGDGERTLLQLADLRGHDREHYEQACAAIANAKQ